jgi:hypothetical protein
MQSVSQYFEIAARICHPPITWHPSPCGYGHFANNSLGAFAFRMPITVITRSWNDAYGGNIG